MFSLESIVKPYELLQSDFVFSHAILLEDEILASNQFEGFIDLKPVHHFQG